MYPPSWGNLFWSWQHAGSKACAKFYSEALPPEIAERILTFMVRLCKYLPCPGCRFHCTNHMSMVPPRFATGEEFWRYTVDFHNAVNVRTGKIEVSYEESEMYLAEQLAEFGWTVDKVEDAFFQDWWTALLLTTFPYSESPDKPTEDEKAVYREFLKDACYIMPFGYKTLGDGRLCRDVMLDFCDSKDMNLDEREMAFASLTGLHNTVCMHFGVFTKTEKEMKAVFGEKFAQKNVSELVRAVQIREEDHKKMSALQKELDELRSGGAVLNHEGDGSVSNEYKTATIALASVLGAVLFLMVVAFVMYRFHIGGHWRIMRTPSRSAKFADDDLMLSRKKKKSR